MSPRRSRVEHSPRKDERRERDYDRRDRNRSRSPDDRDRRSKEAAPRGADDRDAKREPENGTNGQELKGQSATLTINTIAR